MSHYLEYLTFFPEETCINNFFKRSSGTMMKIHRDMSETCTTFIGFSGKVTFELNKDLNAKSR